MSSERRLFPNATLSDQPTAYLNGDPVSAAAAAAVTPKLSGQARTVFNFIKSRGEYGATDNEIMQFTGIVPNSARPRRIWLKEKGFVAAKTGEDGVIIQRNRSTVWVTTGLDPVFACEEATTAEGA